MCLSHFFIFRLWSMNKMSFLRMCRTQAYLCPISILHICLISTICHCFLTLQTSSNSTDVVARYILFDDKHRQCLWWQEMLNCWSEYCLMLWELDFSSNSQLSGASHLDVPGLRVVGLSYSHRLACPWSLNLGSIYIFFWFLQNQVLIMNSALIMLVKCI
mgnify:CR=1 FL=1